MNLHKLVASLELSQEYARLMKEKGREMGESYFVWVMSLGNYTLEVNDGGWSSPIPALTSGEIGDKLPFVIEAVGENYYLTIDKAREYWHVNYQDIDGITLFKDTGKFCDETEADARLKMLNYLLGNDLI